MLLSFHFVQTFSSGAAPGVTIRDVTISQSNNGAGILAQGGARGSATLTDVTISGSADGDVVIEPGSQFQITGGPAGVTPQR